MMMGLGACLVMAATLGAFYSLRLALHLRERELLSWLAAVRLLSREISYGMTPLPRVCEGLGARAEGVAGEFFAALSQALQADAGRLGEAWEELLAAQGGSWHLSPDDLAVLSELGGSLGRSNFAEQKKLLAVAEERLRSLAEESAARYERLSRLLSGLGWCSGLLLVCLCL